MRTLTLLFFSCLLIVCCKKEEVIVVTPVTKPMDLKVDQVINDSTILLKWSKFSGPDFEKYLLVRTATYFKNGQFQSFTEPVDSSNNVNQLAFTENNMPLASDIYYDVYVVRKNTPPLQNSHTARVYYKRQNALVNGILADVFIEISKNYLYITEYQKIYIVDYLTGRIVTAKSFPMGIGYCSIADFKGSKELYVPVHDGWVHILDPATLELKDRIYVGGYGIGSVVAANEKLYVTSSELTRGGYYNCLKVYDRATKDLVTRTGNHHQTRLVKLENTAVEMIELTRASSPVDLHYFSFSTAGLTLSFRQDTYHGDHAMDAEIVRSFPDGSKFITSGSGTIFNKSLIFDRYLKQYAGYTDFAFNNDGSIIYAAVGAQKRIDVITYPAITTTRSYQTKYFPYKIFRDGNKLICVSKTDINQQWTHILVENINL